MGLGTWYTMAESEKAIRRYWRGWPVTVLERCQELDNQVTCRIEVTCEVSVYCDRCGQNRCGGCGERVLIDITGGNERVTCIPRCEEP